MSAPEDARSKTEIEADLEATREHLAETVDALHHRLDVKTRVSDRATELRRDHGRELSIGAVALVAAVVSYVVVRRRRRHA